MSPVYGIMLYFAGKMLNQNADPTILLDFLSYNSNIVESEIIGTYPLDGKKSVTYRISIFVYKEPDNVWAVVERILCGIGCRLRV